MKYKKKPVEIEAFQLGVDDFPDWFMKAVDTYDVIMFPGPTAEINTLEGIMVANCNDFIIKGVAEELYPCKPDIFMLTYEPAE